LFPLTEQNRKKVKQNERITHRYVKALSLNGDSKGFNYQEYFPDFFEDNDKCKVLFVGAKTDVHSWFKMISPGVMWAKSAGGIATCISNIESTKNELNCTTEDFELEPELVKIAHIIVFPFTSENLIETYRYIRFLNPTVKIIYSVEYDFYSIPESHKHHEIFSKDVKLADVEDNVSDADFVFVPSDKLAEKLIAKIKDETKLLPGFIRYQYQISPQEMFGIDTDAAPALAKKEGVKRIGIISHYYDRDEIAKYIPKLEEMSALYKNKIEFVVWGADLRGSEDGETKTVADSELQEFPGKPGRKKVGVFTYRRFKFENYIYHHKNLFNLGLDAVFFLKEQNEFNSRNGTPQEVYDCMFFDIPVFSTIQFADITKSHINYITNTPSFKNAFDKIVNNYPELKGKAMDARVSFIAVEKCSTEASYEHIEKLYRQIREQLPKNRI